MPGLPVRLPFAPSGPRDPLPLALVRACLAPWVCCPPRCQCPGLAMPHVPRGVAPQAAEVFTSACRAHGVPAPGPAPDHDTTSHQYRQAVAPRAPLTSSRFVVRGCSLQTPPTLRRMLLGKSCRIGICIGLPCTQGNPGVGHLNGSACGATPLSMRTIRCCKACLQRPSPPACTGFTRVQPRLGLLPRFAPRSSPLPWPTHPAPRISHPARTSSRPAGDSDCAGHGSTNGFAQA